MLERCLLKLGVSLENLAKVAHRLDRLKGLLKHIAGLVGGGGGTESEMGWLGKCEYTDWSSRRRWPHLLKVATANVVACKGAPQTANHVRVAAQPATDDGLDANGLNVAGVLADELAQLDPELMRRLAPLAVVALAVDDLGLGVGGGGC